MNLTDLATLIEKLEDDGFTSSVEKLIAVVLANLDEDDVQQCEIIGTLKLGDRHCRDILKSFVEKCVIEISGRRDVFYRMSHA